MKKAFIVLLAVSALFCMVSCNDEAEPKREVLYNGTKYDFDYVYVSYVRDEGLEVVFSTNPALEDIYSDEGTHFEFEIPIEMINKTSTFGIDSFSFYWDFYGSICSDGDTISEQWYPSDGSVLTMASTIVDDKVTELTFNYNGTADGKNLAVSFSGTPDFSYTDSWLM